MLGTDHPDAATSYKIIGRVYYANGDHGNALVEYRNCLEIKLKLLGNNRFLILIQ